MVTGEHTVTGGQANAHQSEKWSRVAIHELSGCTSAQVGRQRVGHAIQQVVDERPPREVPSVLPARGTRRTTIGDDGIQRSGVHASRCRPGSHQQPGVIGTAEAQQRRAISVEYAHRESHRHSEHTARTATLGRGDERNCRDEEFATHITTVIWRRSYCVFGL